MSKYLSYGLSILLLFSSISAAVVFNMNKPRIFVLHSYNNDYSWTRDVNVGLQRILEGCSNYEVTWYYMNAKKYGKNQDWLRRARFSAAKAIKDSDPDVLIAVDNIAQSVAKRYVNHPKTQLVFAGINGPIKEFGYHGDKKGNTTGILENRPCDALKDLLLSIEPVPDDRNIRVRYLLDSSASVLADKPFIDTFNWHPIVYTGSVIVETFEDWKRQVLNSERETDYLIVTNYRQLRRSATDSNTVDPSEVMGWTEKFSPVRVVGLNPFNVADGGMLSVGVSPFEQGEITGQMAKEILEKKINAGSIPIMPNRLFIVCIRKSAMDRRGIVIPKVYEAFSRAMDTYIE